jgi:ubiquinone/menaquinone biosynthesis C-methylase UbiE
VSPDQSVPSRAWLLDELGTAGRENLDAGHVARYDGKEPGDALAEVSLLQSIGITADATVIDLGAGTGQFAIAAAAHVARVVAVDVSPVMLRALRSKIAAAGLTNIAVVHAGFLTYEHQGPPADAVYSRYALHHLPDFWKAVALDRMHRMLRRGGILRLWDVVYDFDASDSVRRIDEWCATGGDDVEADWSRAELEEHVRDENSTFTWLLEPMIERSGFAITAAAYSDDAFSAKYVLTKL